MRLGGATRPSRVGLGEVADHDRGGAGQWPGQAQGGATAVDFSIIGVPSLWRQTGGFGPCGPRSGVLGLGWCRPSAGSTLLRMVVDRRRRPACRSSSGDGGGSGLGPLGLDLIHGQRRGCPPSERL
jgi:hypothetical protein